jgi:hypothetical protein
MYECGTCGNVFPSGYRARNQHCNATGHSVPDFECDTCDAWFGSQSSCWQHMRAKDHFSSYRNDNVECSECDETFETDEACREHQIEDHYYCTDCDRHFVNYNIKMVITSSYAMPLRFYSL